MNVFNRLKLNMYYMDETLDQKKNFDIIKRNIKIVNQDACIYYLDDFVKDKNLQDTIEKLFDVKQETMKEIKEARELVEKVITYPEVSIENNMEQIILNLLSGVSILFVDHMADAIMIDARKYPNRSINEPEKDKILRGSKDGFVEAAISNVSMIRRRIRSTDLTFEHKTIGEVSHSDVVICYMKEKVDKKQLNKMMEKIDSIQVESLTMGSESLAELLVKRKWYNPFPKFKYTERPDTATAQILEGNIIILVDNSPSAMITPTSIFDIVEEADDYYFPPITGTYLRLSRFLIAILTYLVTPVFLLLMQNPQWIPERFQFIMVKDVTNIPLLWQFLLLELAIDGLRLAAVNTPNMLSTPLSVMAALVLGEFSVNSGWFNSEVMLYMAFVAIASYTQQNYELSYAIKFMRIINLILTQLFGLYGFLAAVALLIAAIISNRTVSGRSYVYPLIPLNLSQLWKRLVRYRLPHSEKQ